MVPYTSLCSSYVTYRTPCHTIGLSTLPREVEDFPRVGKYPKESFALLLRLLATNFINNSGLIVTCVNITNVFTFNEETSKLAV